MFFYILGLSVLWDSGTKDFTWGWILWIYGGWIPMSNIHLKYRTPRPKASLASKNHECFPSMAPNKFFVPKMQDKFKKTQEICTWFGVVNILLCNTISVFSKSLTDLLPFSECSHLHGLAVNAWSNPAGPFGGLQRVLGKWENLRDNNLFHVPSRGLTYPTLGKGKSSSKCHFWGIC